MVTRHVVQLTRWISSPQILRCTESGGLELDLDFSKRLIKESKLFLSVCVKSVWYHNCSAVNYSLSDWDQHLPKINNYQIRTKKVVSLFSFQPCYLINDNYSAGWLWKYISFLRTSLSHRKKKKLSAKASASKWVGTGKEPFNKLRTWLKSWKDLLEAGKVWQTWQQQPCHYVCMFISENNTHFNRLQTLSLYHVDRNV